MARRRRPATAPDLRRAADRRRRRLTGLTGILAGGLLLVASCATAAPGPGTAETGARATDRAADGRDPSGTGGTGTTAGTEPVLEVPLPAGPFPVRTRTVTLVDASRPTAAGAQTPAAPDRTLVTTIHEPDVEGSFPLIVFSHGLFGHPDKFSQLLSAWAAAGFVVAAPAFPLTNDRVPGANGNWGDLANQPGDVSFVIDRMLAADEDPADPLHGRLRRDRIGAGGLSLGGATTYAVTFDDCCRDPRIDAAEVLAGAELAVGGDYHLDGHVPLLIVHGDADRSLPYPLAVAAWDGASGPVWFVTLAGGTHAPPFEDTPTPYDELVTATTTDFWLGTLGGRPGALDRVSADATVAGLSSIQRK